MTSKQPVTSRRSVSPRIAGLCGILGPVIGLVFITSAILQAPWFSWTDNWLSDLGGEEGEGPIWSARGTESVLFNSGILLTGSMGVVFALGFRNIRILNTPIGRRGTSFLLVSMTGLLGVGIFPETLFQLHGLAAVTFFMLLPFSLLYVGTALMGSSDPGSYEDKLGKFARLLGCASLSLAPLLAVPRPWGGNAVAEMFPAVIMALFSMVSGFGLLKGRIRTGDPGAAREKGNSGR